MVHNGIEYGLMQLISETYDLMKRGMGLSNEEVADVYAGWNQGESSSYLIEITSQILRRKDDQTGKPLVDLILGVARQKGTGQWTSQEALELEVPIPTIDIAVAMRDLSGREAVRQAASKALLGSTPSGKLSRDALKQVQNAFHAAMIITFAQGMAQLQAASKAYSYNLNLEAIARIWRGGCIIRAALLEDIRAAYKSNSGLPDLMVDPKLAGRLNAQQTDLRAIVRMGVESGVPVGGHSACLTYFDAYRSGWMPFNLIQAQRDFFGAHMYERIDQEGVFHTRWSEK
jgi:6-phosphogluconate dehydrogenase